MNRKYTICIAVAAALAVLGSCRTGKQAASGTAPQLSRELQVISENVSTLPDKEGREVLDNIADLYTDWNEVSFDGKISMKGLPIDPSFRIWMRQGSDIIISLRAPILGEVGRLEVASDSITVINRMDKCFTRQSTSDALSRLGMSVIDAQDLLLGRVFTAGSGTLSRSSASKMVVTTNPGGGWILTPKKQHQLAQYGFTVYPDLLLQIAFATSSDDRYQANLEYTWDTKNPGRKSVDVDITAGNKAYHATLDCKEPDFDRPRKIDPAELGKKYKRVSFRRLLSSVK